MLSVATLVALCSISVAATNTAQRTVAAKPSGQRTIADQWATPKGLPQDWSHRSVVYRNPDTPDEARIKGRLEQWRRDYRDPRFVLALARRMYSQAEVSSLRGGPKAPPPPSPPSLDPIEAGMTRDWSHVLGGGANGTGGKGSAGVYPAKYSFDISATPSCANDFVVYPTGTAGASDSGGAKEVRTSSFTGVPGVGETISIGLGTRSVTLLVTLASNADKNFTSAGSTTNSAINLAAAVNRWSGTTGVTASVPVAGSVTFSRINGGNDTSDLAITELLTGYAVANHVAGNDGAGTAGQPTIIAFNQLYNTTCSGTRTNSRYPNVFWSYNTGNGAVVRTSPVLSWYDNGQQVAFVQSNVSNQAELVLLKWSSASPGTAGAPTVPTVVTQANYRTCTAPCMTVMTFSGTPDDSFSSPYVDYFGDTVWVGANNGTLHKFTGVFKGTPVEVVSGGFPASVSAGNALSSPVFDFGGKQVFVGSARGAASGGNLHRVDGTTGAVVSSGQLAINSSTGLRASPVLDSSAGRAYAWVFDDGVNGDGITCGATVPCQSVYQFSTAFAGGTTGNRARVGSGNGGTAAVLYNGTFDDAYYTSATPTGALYACGALPTDPTTAVLWKIPITNNVMGTPVQGPSISSTGFTGNCSPVSEIKNGDHDYIYVGIPDHATDGPASVCGTGLATDSCLYMFDLSDLDGPMDTNETWVGTFTGGGAQSGDTITINGTVITVTSENNSIAPPYTFRNQGSGKDDAEELATVAGALSGTTNITVSNTTGSYVVTFTYAIPGNVADNLITEALTAFTITSHTDGISGGGSPWATTSVPSAGLTVFGSVGGLVMDNISTTTGTSQVYFSNTGTDCDTSATTTLCGNAYQASQSGLQ
jgi:hypothetical protein